MLLNELHNQALSEFKPMSDAIEFGAFGGTYLIIGA